MAMTLKDVLAAVFESSDEDERRVSEPDGFSSDEDEDYDHRRDPRGFTARAQCNTGSLTCACHQVTTSPYTATIITNPASQEVPYPPASTSTPTYTATIITNPASQEVPNPPASTSTPTYTATIITNPASQEVPYPPASTSTPTYTATIITNPASQEVPENRKDCPRTTNNALTKKSERGSIRWIRDGSLIYVKWMDTREVSVCSTLHTAYSGNAVQRRVKQQYGSWTRTSIPCPTPVMEYNEHMGGVDHSDQLIQYYSAQHKTMRWYRHLFYHFLDIATTNSYILHKELCLAQQTTPMTHKAFMEELTGELCGKPLHTAPVPIHLICPGGLQPCLQFHQLRPDHLSCQLCSGHLPCWLCPDHLPCQLCPDHLSCQLCSGHLPCWLYLPWLLDPPQSLALFPLHGPGPLSLSLFRLCSTSLLDL
ncbi:unnamed protein product [Leuciscus chuanchicus]